MSAAWTTPKLVGRHVSLAPLQRTHAEALAHAARDGELWTLPFTSVPSPGTELDYIDSALASVAAGMAMAFTVFDADGDVVGTTRYYDIERSVPSLHIGYTWYARRVQRTALNTEAKHLLLQHAFDTLGCEVVCFQTSHLNARSQAAIERLGARRDGILRAHMRHRDGTLRDTHHYSIVRAEWPGVSQRLRERLVAGEIA